jgi:hypothetical protein
MIFQGPGRGWADRHWARENLSGGPHVMQTWFKGLHLPIQDTTRTGRPTQTATDPQIYKTVLTQTEHFWSTLWLCEWQERGCLTQLIVILRGPEIWTHQKLQTLSQCANSKGIASPSRRIPSITCYENPHPHPHPWTWHYMEEECPTSS